MTRRNKWKMSLPPGVVVSIFSVKLIKSTPRSLKTLRVAMRSWRERPRRSSFQTTTVSPGRINASNSSKPLRSNFDPVILSLKHFSRGTGMCRGTALHRTPHADVSGFHPAGASQALVGTTAVHHSRLYHRLAAWWHLALLLAFAAGSRSVGAQRVPRDRPAGEAGLYLDLRR